MKKKLLLSLSIGFLATQITFAKVEAATQTVHDKTIVYSGAKTLTGSQMPLLNVVLEQYPMVTVRIKFAEAKIKQVLQNMTAKKDPVDKGFIETQLKLILDPAKDFFDIIRENKSMVSPLIDQCFEGTGRNASDTMLGKLFNISKPVEAFALEEITSVSLLEQFCHDCSHVFSSLYKSISETARKKAVEELKKMKSDSK